MSAACRQACARIFRHPFCARSSAAYGTTRGASGGLGGGGGEPGSARTPSVRDIHSQTVAALLQRAASINASHGASMTAASVAALNKQPSVRNHASGGGGGNGAAAGHAPHLGSLPPLPSGASYHEGGQIAAAARAALAAAEVAAAAGPVVEAELSDYYRAEPTTPAAVLLTASAAVSTSGIMSGPSAQVLAGLGGSGAVGYGASPSQSPRTSQHRVRMPVPPPAPPGAVPGALDAAAAVAAAAREAAAAGAAHAPLLAGVTSSSDEDADGRLRLGSGGGGKLAARAPTNGGSSSRGSSPSGLGAGL